VPVFVISTYSVSGPALLYMISLMTMSARTAVDPSEARAAARMPRHGCMRMVVIVRFGGWSFNRATNPQTGDAWCRWPMK
jgi:hypothetical protein